MVYMKRKNTRKNKFSISQKDLSKLSHEVNDQYEQEGKVVLEGRSAQALVACLNSFEVILEMLSKTRMRLGAVRKLFGIEVAKPEKSNDDDSDDDCGEPNPDQGDVPDSDGTDDAVTAETSNQVAAKVSNNADETTSTELESADQACESEPGASSESNGNESNDDSDNGSRSKHGPNHASQFPNAELIDCEVPGLKKGDECPSEDCKGRLYSHQPVDSPRRLIVFDAQAPIDPTIYKLNDLQCNSCKAFFKAELPTKLAEQGVGRVSGRQYTYRCIAFLLVAHYYFGRSFRSIDQLNGMIGDRVADSTLNGKALEQRSYFARLWGRMLKIASNCLVFYGDDISSKVNSILPEIKMSRNGEYAYRNGIYTSIVIGVTDEGKPIPIFTTGLHHLGETFDKVLADRDKGLSKPVVIRDQSSSNKITECDTTSAGCLQHARDYFVKAGKNYPIECDEILDKMSQIFEVDRQTHDLSPTERVDLLKQDALPIMEDIHLTVEALIAAKEATPSSDMGTALNYFKKHYPSLMIPYKIPGIGLTNNLSEWMTYPVVRYINNCRHYATKDGAEIGDYTISLTMMALLAGRNPIKYLEYLLANKIDLENQPSADFLPWDLPLDTVPHLEKNWFTNWIPQPWQAEDRKDPLQDLAIG
jgi:hypothetical protein